MNNYEKQVRKFSPYSVLMSVYYKESPIFLQQALESMFGQTIAPTQVVLVEDGQLTPELYGILEMFSVKYKEKFCRVVNETNLGLGASLNRGLAACDCELIARMDTDDISDLARCEKQLAFFSENPDTDIVGTNIAEFIDSVDKIVSIRNVPSTHKDISSFMKKRCPFNHVSVMFKKTSVQKAGGYLDWHFNEDYYLWIRMYLAGARFANLNETLVYARVGEEMYARRGGKQYYKSEKALFAFMYRQKIISLWAYRKAVAVRFIVQRMMTNKMRQWFFRKFARKQSNAV